MDTSTVVLVTLIAYNGVLIAVGLWANRRAGGADGFFLAERSLGPLAAAISYSASSCSAWTLLGMSGAAFVMGVSALWLALGAVLGMVVTWHFVAPPLMALSHRHRLQTMTDLLALGSHGRWRTAIVVSASLIIIVAFSFYVSAQFQGAGSAFRQSFGLAMPTSIILGGAIILVYTLLGGFLAVSVTDVVQGLLMALAALLLPLAALVELGGIDGFVDGLVAASRPDQLSLSGRNVGLAGAGFILGTLGVAFGSFGQPHLMVRFMALRDARALRQARVIALFWFIVVFGGMCLAGLAGHVLIPDLGHPESLFFALSDRLFPAAFAAVMIAAVLSAVMSTADSQLLVGASAVVHDLGLGRRFPQRTLLISRVTMTALVVLSIVISLTLPASIFERALLAWTALGAAFGPLVIFRVAGIAVRPAGAFASILCGFALAVLFHFNPGQVAQALLPAAWPASILERVASFAVALAVLAAARVSVAELSPRSAPPGPAAPVPRAGG